MRCFAWEYGLRGLAPRFLLLYVRGTFKSHCDLHQSPENLAHIPNAFKVKPTFTDSYSIVVTTQRTVAPAASPGPVSAVIRFSDPDPPQHPQIPIQGASRSLVDQVFRLSTLVFCQTGGLSFWIDWR
jgi:hypothetical protein